MENAFCGAAHTIYNTRAREKSVKRRRKIWLAPKKSLPLHRKIAPVAKLVDALDLGSSVSRRVGSSPIRRTTASRLFHLEQSGFFVPAILVLERSLSPRP